MSIKYEDLISKPGVWLISQPSFNPSNLQQPKPLDLQEGWKTTWCFYLQPVLQLQKATLHRCCVFFCKTVIILQRLSSSRKVFLPADTRKNIKWQPSPHCQGFSPAVWIHKEAPGNGFLMGSWHKTDELMLRYVKYLLFRLLSELWPYLKQGPNEGQLFIDWFTWGVARSLKRAQKCEMPSMCSKTDWKVRENLCEEQETQNLTWEQSSMTSSTTEVLDFMHTRPVESNHTSVYTQLQC